MKKYGIFLLIFCIYFCAKHCNAESNADSPFSITAETLRDMCLKDEKMCQAWILGVIEGMEFSKIMILTGGEKYTKNHIFCYPGNDVSLAIQAIQKKFMHDISLPEYKNMLDKPAILSISKDLSVYQCRD